MMIHPLLPELIRLQRRDRYLAPDALSVLSQQLEIPVNRIISVASFYQAFRFKPCGKHQIKVCIGADRRGLLCQGRGKTLRCICRVPRTCAR